MTQVDADSVLRKMEAKIAELTRTIYVYESQVEKLYAYIQELEAERNAKELPAKRPLKRSVEDV